jgi:hypothetical protein
MRTCFLFFLGAFGCGSPSVLPTSDAGTTRPSYGTIGVELANAFESNTINGKTVSGQPEILSALLMPNATASAPTPCAAATITDGACCYVPAAPLPDAGGLAGADGGLVMLDVGPITFTDVTSGAALGSLDYSLLSAGFGFAEGYPAQDLGPAAWSAGDTLQVAVQAGPLGSAFTAQTRALASPKTPSPASIARAQGLTISWAPDANADVMTVTLVASAASANHGGVACVAPDASMSVTITPAVLAGFAPGDAVVGVLTRTQSQQIDVSGGNAVTFVTSASSGFTSQVE